MEGKGATRCTAPRLAGHSSRDLGDVVGILMPLKVPRQTITEEQSARGGVSTHNGLAKTRKPEAETARQLKPSGPSAW